MININESIVPEHELWLYYQFPYCVGLEHLRGVKSRNRRQGFYKLSLREWYGSLRWWRGRCAYCGFVLRYFMNPNSDRYSYVSLEHIRGRDTVIDNVVPTCVRCNNSRGSEPVLDWLRGRYGLAIGRLFYVRLQEYISCARAGSVKRSIWWHVSDVPLELIYQRIGLLT